MSKAAIVFWSETGSTEAMANCIAGGYRHSWPAAWRPSRNFPMRSACFDCYRRCIQTYAAVFEQGIPIGQLAVPA